MDGYTLLDTLRINIKDVEFMRVFEHAELYNIDSVFKDGDWHICLEDGYIIFKMVYKDTREILGLVGLEVSPNDQYLNLTLLETMKAYRSRNVGKILIAFSFFISKKYIDSKYDEKRTLKPPYFMTIASKTNAREYYEKKIGATCSPEECDMFIIDEKLGNNLISDYLTND